MIVAHEAVDNEVSVVCWQRLANTEPRPSISISRLT